MVGEGLTAQAGEVGLRCIDIRPDSVDWPASVREALDVADGLIGAGIPVFVCKPDGVGADWNPRGGTGGTGYFLRRGWQNTVADPAELDEFEPGCALAMVCGHGLDGIDVDLYKDDQGEARLRAEGVMPAVYAEASTPSGGKHFLVASLGIHSRDGVRAGLDVKAGTSSGGRGFLFIAPTVKLSKASGKPRAYSWVQRPGLQRLGSAIRDDHSGHEFAKLVEAARTEARRRPHPVVATPSTPVEVDPVEYSAMPPGLCRRIDAYIAKVVDGTCNDLKTAHAWPEGYRDDRGRGWEKCTADAAMRLGQLARAAWNRLTLEDAFDVLIRNAPVDGAWTEVDVVDKWRNQSGRGDAAPHPPFAAAELAELVAHQHNMEVTSQVDSEASHGRADVSEGAESRSTWAPVDLRSILAGANEQLRPTLFPRTDGQSLLYSGMVHSFHGESESGKSLLVQIEAARLILSGKNVLYLDFESDPSSVVRRLEMLGADSKAIIDHFDYRRPEAKPDNDFERPEWLAMLSRQYDLAVIDGVTDSLGVFGGSSSKDNDAVASWMRALPRPLATKTGAAVVMVDHVTKDRESRGRFAIGGQAKMAGLTGAAYIVEVTKPIGRGMKGVIELRVGKDRPGAVRAQCGSYRKSDRTQLAARVVLDSTGSITVVSIEPPDLLVQDEHPGDEGRQPELMERAHRAIEQSPGLTKSGIVKVLGGNRSRVLKAIDVLVEDGRVAVEEGPRRAQLLTIKKFQETENQSSGEMTGTGSGSYTEEPENQYPNSSGNL
ncbi:hypothetical protein RHCRD62_90099 [Rhodococcus sp. RD6.2]|uniref:AAA family ATPase n=1 Tax=Rhodococcus sp. RD6.2 TaxID=260936 RepID=UPI00063B159E|nr:AAA family ATPase [Rhodococcus sp. RD6.2]CRK54420.1 hypothetical protein RHCRD62_90099 [Rhodococcus sp. RD6.2]